VLNKNTKLNNIIKNITEYNTSVDQKYKIKLNIDEFLTLLKLCFTLFSAVINNIASLDKFIVALVYK